VHIWVDENVRSVQQKKLSNLNCLVAFLARRRVKSSGKGKGESSNFLIIKTKLQSYNFIFSYFKKKVWFL
jgi:hypothetical protein